MKEIDAEPGTSIATAAFRLVTAALNEDRFLTFNGIYLTADRHSTVEGICADYDRLSELRAKEYRESPEGIAQAERQESERIRLQSKADFLMAELPLMDFTDTDLLIKWLCDIEDARDRIGVNVDNGLIQRTFMKHGYEPNAYCGDDFVKGNPDIEKRWLIGQAIADVYVPMVRHFAKQI